MIDWQELTAGINHKANNVLDVDGGSLLVFETRNSCFTVASIDASKVVELPSGLALYIPDDNADEFAGLLARVGTILARGPRDKKNLGFRSRLIDPAVLPRQTKRPAS